MAGREISLFLKYPGSSIALQRLQHSFLECVVEHKSGSYEELQACPPSYLKSDYQLKGTATLEEDELVITFTPKHSGLHTVRLFADTRELCKPVAFIVNQSGEIESTPIDKPVRQTSSLFRQVTPSPAPSSTIQQQQQIQQQLRMSQAFGTLQAQNLQSSTGARGQIPFGAGGGGRESADINPNAFPSQQQQPQLQQPQPQYDESFHRGFTSDPGLSRYSQEGMHAGGRAVESMYQQQRFSHVTSVGGGGGGGGSRPTSMMPVREEQGFPGDLHSMTAEKSSFNQLHTKKLAGEEAKVRRDFLMVDHSKVVTPNTFESLSKDISKVVGNKGMKTRRRCTVCSKKVKMSKLVYLGDHDFCESCFKRQYALRSAVDHFYVPMIQESAVDVPINKKGTKFITTRKTIPDLNLRGLEASEVRYAQEEFKKFEMDSSGWINKAVLYPLLKACFSSNLKDQEIKHLLSSQAFRSLIISYGIDDRDEVHELEFLSLLAFLAREAISLTGVGGRGISKATKFSPSDLQMAYAFHNKFGKGLPTKQPWGSDPGHAATHQKASPSHISPSHLAHAPHYRLNTSPQHASSGLGQPVSEDTTSVGQRQMGHGRYPSPREYQGHSESYGGHSESYGGHSESYGGQMQPSELAGQRLNQSARYSGMQFGNPMDQGQHERDEQRMNMLLASPSRQPHGPHSTSMPVPQGHVTSPDHERKTMSSTMQLYPLGGGQHHHPPAPTGNREMLDASRTSAFSAPSGPPPVAPELQDLPEEDQDETQELPTLPPNKDPMRHTISLQKKQANSKRIMQDLKLTGDSADSWMMY